jgi:predicted alpha/beta-fold hydrolase
MTLYSWGNPRYFPALPQPERRYFDVAPRARVVAECHWQSRRWERATLVALHGLNGSSGAHYMRGLAAKAFARGLNVVRLNQRNCGDTEHLADGLFHSGLTADAAHVVHELAHVDGLPVLAVAGYSLGGNLALKLAGEYGGHAPRALVAVAAVSPIIEIEECTRALERPGNVLYQWNFVKDLNDGCGARIVWRRAATICRDSTASERSANSMRPTPRPTSGSAAPRTITIAPAQCGSSIASAYRP